jgi:PilZ domain
MQVTPSASKQRAERRIAVRLPLTVRGRDSEGRVFEEETSSENLCRGGVGFITRLDLAIGSDLEILIPFSQTGARRSERGERDFATSGRVIHVRSVESGSERMVGVQFTGPRFRRLFHSESAA